jgi:hypothetical protein
MSRHGFASVLFEQKSVDTNKAGPPNSGGPAFFLLPFTAYSRFSLSPALQALGAT